MVMYPRALELTKRLLSRLRPAARVRVRGRIMIEKHRRAKNHKALSISLLLCEKIRLQISRARVNEPYV